jgi:hypothetical protein
MIDDYIRFPRETDPACVLPENLDATVWRYMDGWKFESLFTDGKLYLCRADRLQDRFEGSYSMKNRDSPDL